MTDPIKDALRAACETDGLFGIKPEADRDIMRDRAAAVAAFLRALPGPGYVGPQPRTAWITPLHMQNLAAAVEKAARDE